ncbi:hypothetical protein [Halorientalis pallida]|uniref:DUF5658 domain-containing protein n=1 Tax=Halorientalis pallida TaxID=2479928 RepID=A0A498KUV0_9EURY|nr:hypothetical protein [Halorientalis pallida]RXK48670.1 hypothetical protein EAF64_13435 [Halorientalis pallida]
MPGDDPSGARTRTERVGRAGIAVMLVAHLVWDPVLTLVGVATFGVAEEDTAIVRTLLSIHPAVWLGAKVVVLGAFTAVFFRIGGHRDLGTAWLPWAVALLAILAPLGWLELLL